MMIFHLAIETLRQPLKTQSCPRLWRSSSDVSQSNLLKSVAEQQSQRTPLRHICKYYLKLERTREWGRVFLVRQRCWRSRLFRRRTASCNNHPITGSRRSFYYWNGGPGARGL